MGKKQKFAKKPAKKFADPELDELDIDMAEGDPEEEEQLPFDDGDEEVPDDVAKKVQDIAKGVGSGGQFADEDELDPDLEMAEGDEELDPDLDMGEETDDALSAEDDKLFAELMDKPGEEKPMEMADEDEELDPNLPMAEEDEELDPNLPMAEEDEELDPDLNMGEEEEDEEIVEKPKFASKKAMRMQKYAQPPSRMNQKFVAENKALEELEMLADENVNVRSKKMALRTQFSELKQRYSRSKDVKARAMLFSELSKVKAQLLKFGIEDQAPALTPAPTPAPAPVAPQAGGETLDTLGAKISQLISIITKKETPTEALEAPADFSEETKAMQKSLKFAHAKQDTRDSLLVKRVANLEKQTQRARAINAAKKCLEGYPMTSTEVEQRAGFHFDEFDGVKGVKLFVANVKEFGVRDTKNLPDSEFSEHRETDAVLKFSDTPERHSKARELSKLYFEEKARRPEMTETEEEWISANIEFND